MGVMLLEQTYEVCTEYNEEYQKSVLGLPKKILVNSLYIYKLRLHYLESTYVHVQYVIDKEEVLVEMIFNLNEKVQTYIDRLYDYFIEIKAKDLNMIEKRLLEYGEQCDNSNREDSRSDRQLLGCLDEICN